MPHRTLSARIDAPDQGILQHTECLPTKKPAPCLLCNRDFPNVEALVQHAASSSAHRHARHRPGGGAPTPGRKTEARPTPDVPHHRRCRLCRRTFPDSKSLTQHLLTSSKHALAASSGPARDHGHDHDHHRRRRGGRRARKPTRRSGITKRALPSSPARSNSSSSTFTNATFRSASAPPTVAAWVEATTTTPPLTMTAAARETRCGTAAEPAHALIPSRTRFWDVFRAHADAIFYAPLPFEAVLEEDEEEDEWEEGGKVVVVAGGGNGGGYDGDADVDDDDYDDDACDASSTVVEMGD